LQTQYTPVTYPTPERQVGVDTRMVAAAAQAQDRVERARREVTTPTYPTHQRQEGVDPRMVAAAAQAQARVRRKVTTLTHSDYVGSELGNAELLQPSKYDPYGRPVRRVHR
jgi:anti-sigma factor ChrR (cupin superfamily)